MVAAPRGPPKSWRRALHELRAAGINARGSLAVGDPLQALEDALRGFDADEVVLSITTTADVPRPALTHSRRPTRPCRTSPKPPDRSSTAP